ncbi:Lipase 1 [Melipona quadrifasciata]|uniref:Lipase 1 n=1 Tax=Melipona quadrifasciata TaxID=166423 RepID=A0A0M8ZQV2_9HYME|nr:Lipase 1 [Melipona quadrifasciata]
MNESIFWTKLAQKVGYITETYKVVTQDGYILQLNKIAGSKKSPDVWVDNVRGTRYSRKHLYPSHSDFWIWHEIGIYNVPVIIDYIIEQTKQKKIFVITHSQDSTVYFVMASERPEYQKKILAPIVFISRTKVPLFRVLAL